MAVGSSPEQPGAAGGNREELRAVGSSPEQSGAVGDQSGALWKHFENTCEALRITYGALLGQSVPIVGSREQSGAAPSNQGAI